MLPTLLAAGEVTSDTMRRLAALLAAFHAEAESGPAVDHDGTVGVILGNWDEHFTQTRPYLDWPLAREASDEIHRRVLAFCRTRASLFDRRIAAGRIRDGHGDLRAEHVCLTDPVAVVDCIEFNHRFRYGDVAADVAFLAMDLEEQGFPDLAQGFVRAYGAYAEDAELPSVLDFYQCYRAFAGPRWPASGWTTRPCRRARHARRRMPPPGISGSRPHTPRDSAAPGSSCVVARWAPGRAGWQAHWRSAPASTCSDLTSSGRHRPGRGRRPPHP
jgi:hypothetical protein